MAPKSVATWVLLALLFVFAIGTVVYWVLYFFVGGVQSSSALWYTRFENSFPAAAAFASDWPRVHGEPTRSGGRCQGGAIFG